ncbi:MAG: CRISPR-associated endonuclease Cas2 [Weeksellaceae bacterium]|nr:CRISPR-associated endonuclease Cas2 [Bacteroidota bacterium]MCG2779415.1 CRISPR-associated endonuclease Cas2 [Weeksellaceae bacterium]
MMKPSKSKNTIIICYDISNNKVRTKFSNFLAKYGVRLQMSVFELEHSSRLLNVIEERIKQQFEPLFEDCDSVFVFYTDLKKAVRYGASKHLDNGLIFLDFTE